MRRIRVTAIIVFLVASAAAYAGAPEPTTQPALTELRPILSPEAKHAEAVKLIDRFIAHVQGSPAFDASAKKAVATAWNTHRDDEHVEDFLTAGVAIISEPFKTGLTALEREEYKDADSALRGLIDHEDDYIALHAQGLLARSLVQQDRLEKAQEQLAPLAAKEDELVDKTFLEAEVDFLLGFCQLANLHYDDAFASLQTFTEQHPDAPDRFRLPAQQMLQELAVRQPEGLGEVSDLMTYAGRGLSHRQPGPPVQIKQTRAVELLNKLIEEAEQREQQQQSQCQGSKCKKCGGKGCKGGTPKGNQQPSSPAQDSQLPPGEGRIGRLNRTPDAKPGDQWGKMPPEERQRILQSLRKSFPSQYRQLVEQYYKQLAKER
jgi:tetratricopeptide (TPR) repeat protein